MVMYANAGVERFPSPSIWANCPLEDIVLRGKGYFFHEDFLGGTASAAATGAMGGVGTGVLSIDCDTDTVLAFKASEVGGYLDIETDGDDNDAFAIFTEPFCYIVENSGNKVWFEARLEIGDADGDQGFFCGLGEEACQSRDVIADDAGDLITETLIGYRILTGEDAIDIVAQKDASAESVVSSDVTANTGVTGYAALADADEWKLGMVFDGKTTVRFYVQGYEIASTEYSTTYFDYTKALCAVIALKTGAAAAESIAIDWVRGAYEEVA